MSCLLAQRHERSLDEEACTDCCLDSLTVSYLYWFVDLPVSGKLN